MRKEWQPLLWFSFRDAKGWRWKVFLASFETTDWLCDGASGCSAFEVHEIYINAADTAKRQIDTLIHELEHVAVENGGIQTDAKPTERFIEASCSPLTRILLGIGFVPPPKPAGYEALHRHAARKFKSIFAAHRVEE